MTASESKQERKKMHQMENTHAALQTACKAMTSSCHASAFSAQELMSEIKALKELKEIGFYTEAEY